MVEQFKVSYGSTKVRRTLPQSYFVPQLDEPVHKHVVFFILLSNEDSGSQAPSLLLYIQCMLYIELTENLDVNPDHNVDLYSLDTCLSSCSQNCKSSNLHIYEY